MSFCGRRTYIDSNGKCHNIQGKTVHEIKALVNKILKKNNQNNTNTNTNNNNNQVVGCSGDNF